MINNSLILPNIRSIIIPVLRVAFISLFTNISISVPVCKASASLKSLGMSALSSTKSPAFHTVPAAEVPEHILPFTNDRYDGVIVNSKKLPDTVASFETMLADSLSYWKETHRRGIWLKIPIEKSQYIPIAVGQGFVFHHAEKDYAMLNNWLATEEENKLPPNASHQVGVGSVVINNEGKLLLVQEKNGPLKNTGIWKLPTGLVDQGEDICDAAIREVKEETGIDAEFISVLTFRQAHSALFGKSDLFFVCILRPTSSIITPQPSEIVACDWIEPRVYFDQPFFRNSGVYSQINKLIDQAVQGGHLKRDDPPVPSLVLSKLPIGFRPGFNCIYHMPGALEIKATPQVGANATAVNSS